MPSLVDYCRSLGLPMISRYASGQRITWTTDAAKATAAQAAGAVIRTYGSDDPRFSGYEVIAHEDAERA